MTKAVLFDIEGTIGDISFVRNVLFPFARQRVSGHFAKHWNDKGTQNILDEARIASGKQLLTAEDATIQFHDWIDQDKKLTPLKALQGILWREGYESGELKAHLYADATSAFDRWVKQGKKLFIYSSGSIDAQMLYLSFSIAGNLTRLFSGYFDTTTGPKAVAESYTSIARAISNEPGNITFFSDAVPEIKAAQLAGFKVYCVDRTMPADFADTGGAYPVIGSFEGLQNL
ncbi:MAG: acireductone synthase [Micropepsaceae bacterium]